MLPTDRLAGVTRWFAKWSVAALAATNVAFLASTSLAAVAFAPPGAGQAGLVVGTDAQGVLRAKLCTQQPCVVTGGTDLGVPAELRAAQARSRLMVVGIGEGRRAIVVSVPGSAGRTFQALVVAPLGGSAPRVLFSGLTGLSEGSDGVRQGQSLNVSEPDPDGTRHILLGIEREDLDLCGRAAVLSPQVLNATDLTLRPARVQRLSSAEREKAPKLVAELGPSPATATPPNNLLRAVGASSAIGSPQALTDGNLETSWAENRGGAGRGEFVLMNAPAELPLTGFEVVLQPPAALPDPSATPREFWLVTRGAVFNVRVPDTAVTTKGARFRITLPAPVQTDCVALVTESAFNETPASRVGFAQLAAISQFESQSPDQLVAALAGGGERAQAAGSVLRAQGEPAFRALVASFDRLDEGGRRVALDVLGTAPCELSAPVYVSALVGRAEAQRLHGQDRLRRCGRASAEPLAERFSRLRGAPAKQVAQELALVAPERAVEAITRRLGQASTPERRELRIVLARATRAPQARAVVRALLVDATLSNVSRLDLLRALGPQSAEILPEAAQALAGLARDPSFDVRFLVLGPAAVLAPREPAAGALLTQALGAFEQPWLRFRAIELAPRTPAFAPALLTALADPHVRVREAAARALGEARLASAAAPLIVRLQRDDWPLVRRAAAWALGSLPGEAAGEAALTAALHEDGSPGVRSAAAESLGRRGAVAALPELRERFDDDEERFEVRARAATALGLLCDVPSSGRLSRWAERLQDPLATSEERVLGEAALAALASLAPADLAQRVAPLAKGPHSKAAQRALIAARTSPCSRARAR